MNINKLSLLLAFSTAVFVSGSFSNDLQAQGVDDALRYSQITSNGTARFVSLGGAFGALGADFSSLSYNPAGLGVYRSSEFTITPSFKNTTINSNFQDNSYKDSRTRFAFDNIGFVSSFSNQKSEEKGLVIVNIGLGYNKMLDFNSEAFARGSNTTSSILDYFAGKANGYNYFNLTNTSNYDPFTSTYAPWDAILAWNTFLIDTLTGQSNGFRPVLNMNDGVNQEQSISSKGSMGEFVISFASNFSNKLFLGATIGIQNVSFGQTVIHRETAFSSNPTTTNGDRLNSMQYKQNLNIDGNGFNFKVGAIYKPIQSLRLGVALHTPTYYSLYETYRASMSSDMLLGTASLSSPRNRYEYDIESPFKAIGSLAFTLEDMGLLSVDVEYLDYTSMRISDGGDGNSFIDANMQIKNDLTNCINIKGGGEVWLGDFALRAGYGLYGNPYTSGLLNSGKNLSVISGGLGYRFGNAFIDFAYQRMMNENSYYFYNLINENGTSLIDLVNRKINEGKVLLTVGYKF